MLTTKDMAEKISSRIDSLALTLGELADNGGEELSLKDRISVFKELVAWMKVKEHIDDDPGDENESFALKLGNRERAGSGGIGSDLEKIASLAANIGGASNGNAGSATSYKHDIGNEASFTSGVDRGLQSGDDD